MEQLKELRSLLVDAWEADTKEHKVWAETVYVCPFIQFYFEKIDPKIKELEEKAQDQPCPKCGETAKHICPTFKMCEVCLNSFDKWTKEELEFGIKTYQKSLQDDPNDQIVKQKLSQIQIEYEKRCKEIKNRPEPQQNQPQNNPQPRQDINNPPNEPQPVNNPIKPEQPKNKPAQPPIPINKTNRWLCENCKVSCWDERENCYIIEQLTTYTTDFHHEVHCFSKNNCSCVEQWKSQHQRTCPQCNKTEWPDMKKGWLLDYEVKKAFCSPKCHVAYREAQWERENKAKATPKPNPASWTKKVELYPMELELSDGGKKDFDWEKEGLKKKVLTLKKITKVLESGSTTKPTKSSKRTGSDYSLPLSFDDEVDTSWIDEALREMEREDTRHREFEKNAWQEYLLTASNSSLQKAEQAYENKYGKAELNALLIGSNQQQPKKNYLPLIIGGGLVVAGIIGLVIWLTTHKKGGNK